LLSAVKGEYVDIRQLTRLGCLLLAGGTFLAQALGVSAHPLSQQPPGEEVVVTAADEGREVQLAAGQVLVVRLQANPSTGYGWQLAEPEAEAIVRQIGKGEFEPDSDLLGAPATQVLRFESVREGETTLSFEYRRPWKAQAKPSRTFHLRVRAKGPFREAQPASSPILPNETPSTTADLSSPDLPAAFNWCDLGGCTPVRDQGQCGSCWAFATAGPLELGVLIRGALAEDLSEQYLVSCNSEGWGCSGGWWAHDYHQWKVPPGDQGAGAVLEMEFPYTATHDPCSPPHVHEYQIAVWHFVGDQWMVPQAVDIKRAIYEEGPVAAAVCVNSAFQSYAGGVFGGPGCTIVNHAVVLVGWDDGQGDAGVWYLRNSWGSEWGEAGYMRIPYGLSNVGFGANYVVYTPSPCYTLSSEASPDEAGTVTLDPAPNCAADQYQPGTEVVALAEPSTGWRFTNWSGAAAGDQPSTTVVVDSHKSATAHFQSEMCIPWFVLPLAAALCWSYKRHHSGAR
jgi:inhibitor of cysteine peptidase